MTSNKPKCGLCGKSKKLIKTTCCNQWICDDNQNYVLFSYARNSCWRNHDQYTLCSYHNHNEHDNDWKTCKKCLEDFDTEDYVDMGTNEYNFEKLKNPPKFKSTKCSNCGFIIVRAKGGYSIVSNKGFLCERCNQHWT